MRIHNIYKIQLLALLTALTACSSEEDVTIPDSQKQPISLSVGVDAPVSRAVITDGTGKTLEAFKENTDIWMVMKSEYNTLSDEGLNYKGEHTAKYCVTYGSLTGKNSGEENDVDFGTNVRYWDDAHARSSALTIRAVAVPGITGDAAKWPGKSAPKQWSTTEETTTLTWSVPTAQTEATMKATDLCFSNNIMKIAEDNDKRMKYGTKVNLKFDDGKMIFYHALTKITIIMKEGNGFNTTSSDDFVFDNITEAQKTAKAVPVELKGFNLGGEFSVEQGQFTSANTSAAITSMHNVEQTASQYTLEAIVMPGAQLGTSGPTDVVSFSLDGNAFKISSEQLAASLRTALGKAENEVIPPLEAGKNYVFTFTINKTGIKVVATIADWNKVEGTNYSPVIRVDKAYGHEGENFAKPFTFYLSENKESGYSLGTQIEYNDSKYSLTTPLYWPDHQTHYFFRGIWPVVDDGTPSGKVDGSKVAVENCKYDDTNHTYPSNLMLALPRKENGDSDETCEVHTDKNGICATEGLIRMNFQYAMSKIEVKLTTTSGADKVTFDENTKVELVDGYKTGAINFSDGSSNFSGQTKAVYEMNRVSDDNHTLFRDAIIPQSLNETTFLKFRITVKGNADDEFLDSYETILGIKDIKIVKEDGNTLDTPKTITTWEPGKYYVYELQITKTGIKVTATIKDWIEARGSTTITM